MIVNANCLSEHNKDGARENSGLWFNSFDNNLKFTIDRFPDSQTHFLDIKLTVVNLIYFTRPHTQGNTVKPCI